MAKESVDGKRGFILYNPIQDCYFFRIYDPVDKRKYADYRICVGEIEVELKGNYLSLYTEKDGSKRLDYSRRGPV